MEVFFVGCRNERVTNDTVHVNISESGRSFSFSTRVTVAVVVDTHFKHLENTSGRQSKS